MSYDAQEEQTVETAQETPKRADYSSPTREQREQLKALSKEVFGVPSRYQKLFQYDEVLTRTVVETVPGVDGAPDTEREVRVPIYAPNTVKVKQSVRRYRTTEEVLELLQGFKAKRDQFLADMKAKQEAAKAKKEADEAAKKIAEELSGSALT